MTFISLFLIAQCVVAFMINYLFNIWKHRSSKKSLLLLLILICFQIISYTQSKESLRYEIDAKRAGIGYTSKDALPRGREFKRIDSTYYVGWMLEGGYKYEHAADVLGFKTAALQLERALYLLDKDFRKQIRTRTSDVMTYIQVMKYQRDWDFVLYALAQCYSNTDEPDKVWALMQKGKKADLQLEIYSETYNYMAWTVHRNRFYTSTKYPFLKNTIDQNEKYANALLDSSALKIKKDAALNKTIFNVNFEQEKMPGIWHYKSILYSYQLNIESGAYYYDKLKSTPVFPENNYATFCLIQGKLDEAEKYYNLAKKNDPEDKRMKESFYYSSIINTYKNENNKGIEELKNLIKANGSTPGFGWYNIGLARNYIYNGQIDEAKKYALTAERFKEIHIGTTLGQSHYDFSVMLINLIIKNKEIDLVKYKNKNWWYSPTDLGKLVKLTFEKYGLQFLLINQFSLNPERDRVVYKIFSTESTVSFDEVWQLIDGFSVNFFLNKFKQEIKTDKRFQVKRYYKLFVAKLLIKKGEFAEAKTYVESAMNEMQINSTFEKLFLARCIECLIICNKELDKKYTEQTNLEKIYTMYPQLIPYSGFTINMKLHSNATTEIEKKIISNLQENNINWVNNGTSHIDVHITFKKKENFTMIELYTTLNNTTIVKSIEFSYKNAIDASLQLGLAIFDISNNAITSNIKK